MRKFNLLLVLLIVGVLLVPSVVVGKVAEACCGVEPVDLTVTDEPDPVCVGEPVIISGTYTVVRGWTPPPAILPYDTGIEIRIWDSGAVLVHQYLETLATGQPDPEEGVPYSFSHDWTPTVGCETYTYEVIAWSYTTMGRMQISFVGGTFESIICEPGACPTIDPCVEQEIRARWAAECKACAQVKNHGEFVSCRAKIVSEYVAAGLVDEEGSSCLVNPLARMNCGKKK